MGDSEKRSNKSASTYTPSSPNAENHELSVNEKFTGLTSPMQSGSGRNKRASYANPTQASKARQLISPQGVPGIDKKDQHRSSSPSGSVWPLPLTSPRSSDTPRFHPNSCSVDITTKSVRSSPPPNGTIRLTSPLTGSLISPLTSPRTSTAPKSHRKKYGLEITTRTSRSPAPLDSPVRSTSSLAETLKFPKQHSNRKLRTKALQPTLDGTHNQNNRLKNPNGCEERETEIEVGSSLATKDASVERQEDYEVQLDHTSEVQNTYHKENKSPGLEAPKETTRSDRLEALTKLFVPTEESCGHSTDQVSVVSPTKEQALENRTWAHQSPGSASKGDKHNKIRYEILDLERELVDDMEKEIEALNDSLHKKEKDIEVRDKALRIESEKVKELSESLRKIDGELVTATEIARLSDEMLEILRKDMAKLTNAAQHVLRRSMDTRLDPKMLQNLSENTIFSPEAKALYSSFVHTIQKLEFRLRTRSTQSDKHQENSATKKGRLEAVEKDLKVTQEREKGVASEGLKAKEELEACKQRYEDERKLRDKAQRDYQSFKKTAEEMYQPDLERKNNKLQLNLVAVQDENIRLHKRVEEYKSQALAWEDECNIIKARAKKECSGLENEIERQKDEMVLYIKDYHDKRRASWHWNVEELQERNSQLERDHEATVKLLNAIKLEKVQLEENAIPAYLDSSASVKQENKKLKYEWTKNYHAYSSDMTGGSAELVPDQTVSLDAQYERGMQELGDTAGRVSELTPGLPFHTEPYQTLLSVPRCLQPKEIARRATKLEKLRQRQKKRREDSAKIDRYREDIIEKARKWKMGNELYEKKGWSDFMGQSSWEIWDGERWMYYADKKDLKIVAALKERGTIPQETNEENKGSPAPRSSTPSLFPRMAELWGDYSGML